MGIWDAIKDYGAYAVGGPAGILANKDHRNAASKFLFGGGATEGLETRGPNADYAQGYLRNQLGGVNGRQAPMAQAAQLGSAAQLAGGPQDQVRAQQMQTAGYLQGVLGGQQAGAGELAVNRQLSSAQAAQQAAARGARGANAALAMRNAQRNTMDMGLAGAGQAAQAQMQDQQMAAGQLGGILAQTRGADLDYAGQNAQLQQQRMLQQGGFNQQAGLANQASQLQTRGQNDAASQAYMAQLLGMDQAQLQAELQKRQIAMQDKGAFPSLLQAGGSALAFASDRRLKTGIRDARAEVDEMMSALKPYAYSYADETYGKGERVGVMAQDLEASEMGRALVIDTPEGLGVDVAKGVSAALAGLARLAERIDQLERKLGA